MNEKSMKKNFMISFLRTGIMLLVPLIIFPYVSRILGKEGVGQVQYIQSIASYFQLFATFGISSYGIREGAKRKGNLEALGKLCTELLLLNFITTTIALAAYAVTFFLEGLSTYRELLLLYTAYILFYGLNLDWFFNVLEDYVYITVRTCIVYGLALVIMFLFLKNSSDVNVYAIVLIFPYVGIFLGNFRQMRRRVPLFRHSKYNLRQHIRPVALVFGIIISSSIYSLLDTTMLGILNGDAAVGLYTAASKLCRLVVQLITAICAVFLPRLSYYVGKNETGKFREMALTSANLIVFIAVPCSFGLLVLAEQAIWLFSGVGFLDAVPATRILAVNLFFSAVDGFLGWQILVPNNRDKVLLGATMLGATADFVLNLILIPLAGVEGAAVATLISEVSVFGICLFYSAKYLNFARLFGHCIKCMVASLPVFLIGLFVNNRIHSVIGSSILTVCLTVVVYLGTLIVTKDTFVCLILKEIRRFFDKAVD